MNANDKSKANRLAALRRFALSITLLNVAGHTILGFEQSWAQPLVALATTYSLEILLELLNAWNNRRPPGFAGGLRNLVDFLLPAHITALAVAMLLYANEQLVPIAFAAAVAIGSKALLRIPIGAGTRHFLNPSNFGITVTLLLFPWIGMAPPYQFTENLSGLWFWILPGLIIASGTFLNARLTHRLPLIVAWAGVFASQAVVRSLLFATPIAAGLLPMSGVVFILYTYYMISDPATTPNGSRAQVAFGGAVAAVYGLLMMMHIVFGLFFALTIVCACRGIGIYTYVLYKRTVQAKAQLAISAEVMK